MIETSSGGVVALNISPKILERSKKQHQPNKWTRKKSQNSWHEQQLDDKSLESEGERLFTNNNVGSGNPSTATKNVSFI